MILLCFCSVFLRQILYTLHFNTFIIQNCIEIVKEPNCPKNQKIWRNWPWKSAHKYCSSTKVSCWYALKRPCASSAQECRRGTFEYFNTFHIVDKISHAIYSIRGTALFTSNIGLDTAVEIEQLRTGVKIMYKNCTWGEDYTIIPFFQWNFYSAERRAQLIDDNLLSQSFWSIPICARIATSRQQFALSGAFACGIGYIGCHTWCWIWLHR